MTKKLTTIGYICRDDKGRIVYSMVRRVAYVPILVVDAIAIREALRVATYLKMDNLLIESDFQIVINFFLDRIRFQVKLLNILQILLL